MLCIFPKSLHQSHFSSPPGKNAFEAQKYCSPFITSLDHTVKYTQKMQKHGHLLSISVFFFAELNRFTLNQYTAKGGIHSALKPAERKSYEGKRIMLEI